VSTTPCWLEIDERDDVVELRRRQWQPRTDPDPYLRYHRAVMSAPWSAKHWRVFALRDASGGIVASCNHFDVDVRLGARRLRLGGVGAVLVPEQMRGRGLATSLLEHLHAWLPGHAYDGAMLFSEIGEPFYARFGYVTLPQARLIADVREYARHRPRDGDHGRSHVRPFEAGDLASVRNLYNTSSALQDMAVLRDDDAWELHALRSRLRVELWGKASRDGDFLVGERDGAVVSYLRTSMDPKARRLVVQEYGLEPGCREDVTAMTCAALDELGSQAPPVVTGVAPQRLANLLPSERVSWRWEDGDIFMVKSFGGFQPPVDVHPDLRLVWQSDWF
jgi:GNAT superfamily N-acetyltransferase